MTGTPNKQSFLSKYRSQLNLWIFLSIVGGFFLGIAFPSFGQNFSLPGDLFLRLLTVLIVPIIVVSMVAGILNLGDTSSLGRLGLKTVCYYFMTTAIAVVTGIILVNIIQPGKESTKLERPAVSLEAEAKAQAPGSGGVIEVLKKIIPKNITRSAVEGNVLGLIFFSIFLGIALLHSSNKGIDYIKPIVACLFDALIWMVDKVMLVAPIGILSLVASLVSSFVLDNKLETLADSIGWYTVTVIAGLLVHGLISLPLILVFFKINPLKFAVCMFPAVSTAFSTASSSATLPITLDSLEHRAKVSNKVASFVAPLGATVNMDGTAIYEAVAAIFIANMYAVDLTFGQQCMIFLTATFSAIGAAGIPGAGLVMMTIVLSSVNLPVEGIQLIVVVDRALDMLRTGINVWGDSIGAVIIASSEGENVLAKEGSNE